jgi:hypothetical protein
MTARKEGERERERDRSLRTRYALQRLTLVTYFIQLDPTS